MGLMPGGRFGDQPRPRGKAAARSRSLATRSPSRMATMPLSLLATRRLPSVALAKLY